MALTRHKLITFTSSLIKVEPKLQNQLLEPNLQHLLHLYCRPQDCVRLNSKTKMITETRFLITSQIVGQ